MNLVVGWFSIHVMIFIPYHMIDSIKIQMLEFPVRFGWNDLNGEIYLNYCRNF